MADRAQAVTLEALLASLLVLGALLFVLQSAAVTPTSASTTNAHLENQHERLASGVLDAAVANGSLTPTLTHWNETNGSFYGTHSNGYYSTGGPPTAFGRLLERSLTDQGLAYNLELSYLSTRGELRRVPLVYVGAPSATAASVSRTVLLTDDQPLYNASGMATNTTLAEADSFFAPDRSPTTPTYNLVRVEVIVWRS